MNIIVRNMLRIIRAGAFGQRERIEPMSAWKWKRALHLAKVHGVASLAYDGIELCADQLFMQLTAQTDSEWRGIGELTAEQNRKNIDITHQLFEVFTSMQCRPILTGANAVAPLYNNPLHHVSEPVSIFFPYSTQAQKADQWVREHASHIDDSRKSVLRYTWNDVKAENCRHTIALTNALLNHTLQNIVEQDIRECRPSYIKVGDNDVETLSCTLSLLLLLVELSQSILSHGLLLGEFVDVGIFLRNAGQNVDFVKLQGWLKRLHMTTMANYCGQVLMSAFGFERDEIPFMETEEKIDEERMTEEIMSARPKESGEWYFKQSGNIFVHTTNSSAMMWQMKQSLKYMSYYPNESITSFFSSFARSLSHIEE